MDLDDTSLLDQWEDAKAKAKEANEAVDAAKARLIASLGAAESGRLADGRLVTYLQQTRKQFTTPANTFRVLRTKESKP